MTKLNDVKIEHSKLCKNAYSMIEKKGADYNRKQQNDGDTLFNLTVPKRYTSSGGNRNPVALPAGVKPF